jgi:hypothetical protein
METAVLEIPVTVTPSQLGRLLGVSLPTAYRFAKELPAAPLSGHKRLLTTGIEKLIGRPLTADDVRRMGPKECHPKAAGGAR